MTSSNGRWLAFLFALVVPAGAFADDWQFGGHLKYQLTASEYSPENIFAIYGKPNPLDHYFDARLKADKKTDRWHYTVHYEVLGLYGDTIQTLKALPSLPGLSPVPNDDRRLLNLSQAFSINDRFAGVGRIDRLQASYTKNQLVLRIGRQAISWGNGLFFNPMDLVAPFSPTAISKEYKTGDDMVYGQWLYANGSDMQAVLLPRRNAGGDVDDRESSYTLKYRGTAGTIGYDLLAAQHYNEPVIGIGLSGDWRGAVLRGDLVDQSGTQSAILNASYSWTWGRHNVSGNIEYYRNGYGSADGNYSTALISTSPLGKRIARGEIFTAGRDYLAVGLAIELTPRLVTSPTWIHNLNDGSGILQSLFNYDWKQDMPLIFGFYLPYGSLGSEFGGIYTGTPGQYYAPGKTVFMQVAYYF